MSLDKEAFRKKIEEKLLQTEEEILQMQEASKPISPENAIGRISRMDAINNKSVADAALRQAKQKLSMLKLAMTKLDSEDFGICVRCKNPIPEKRLLFRPQSSLCVPCAERS